MKKYPAENWKALGRWIYEARMQGPDDRDMDEWSKKVGRSTRQLRGLERGEPVGDKTLALVADALGIEQWYLFGRLADPEAPDGLALRPSDIARMKSAVPTRANDGGLADIADQELIDELARRLAARAEPKEGQAHGQSPAKKSVSATGETRKQSDYTPAAREGVSEGRGRRKRQDQEGEGSQVDPRADDTGA